MSLPSKTLRRVQLPARNICKQQQRNATLLQRPHIPYTFTQLISLTDGSTFTLRTTSPAPILRTTKDTRNSPLWNPSLSSLRNQEQDEAGRLRAFREKFGRGWDIDAGEEGVEGEGEGEGEGGIGRGRTV
ncbi:Mitochondrial 54S ribosomal protein L36 [Lachnellula arida]|uniref:Mitochondrial 54S ribosomal protein L36 n=2 Tax=Lachnellula TaxID=47830 RepID=A0A8T9B2S9_9HELO|nr:Mitochondrial 54S ribosomal protein L36 [Lachnellula arida]